MRIDGVVAGAAKRRFGQRAEPGETCSKRRAALIADFGMDACLLKYPRHLSVQIFDELAMKDK